MHPFRAWLSNRGLDCESAAQLCYQRGVETSAAYLRQIVNGRRRPSYGLAKKLAELTENEVTAIDFLEWRRAA